MTYLIVSAVLLLVVALFHLVAGLVIANGLYRGAILVGPKRWDLSVRVRRVSKNSIDLESPTPRQDIGHPGRLGLRWSEGYAQLGEVIAVEGAAITREYNRVEGGDPPVCDGPLDQCTPIELDSYFYPHGPGDVGLRFEEVVYDSPLGPIGAWLVPADPGTRWAVHCHGWTAERRELVRLLPSFHVNGITSLVIDYRNDPGAPLDPTGRYRFGLTEWEDLEAAVRISLERGADDIVLTGCSTGGAVVLSFLENSELAEHVVAVVLDAPNVIVIDTVRHATRDSRGTRLMKEFGFWIADLRWGIDWETTNYVQRADRYLHVPTLVFHGTSDHTVPISESQQLAHRVPDLVRLVETPAAGHVMSWNAEPERYERYLVGFLGGL
ncbi:MAG TPA: alpha/beta fold hydrolase [Acidimicrobiia bacterium]|nr:alpha/beta fold hydrolase [Acidimicrobiia bacterium]